MSRLEPDKVRDFAEMLKDAFNPPGGCTPNPHPDVEFSDWGYLIPNDAESDSMHAPKTFIRGRVDEPEPWMKNGNSSTGSKAKLPSDVNRDIVELGPENPWKPYKECEDSRYEYPMGSLFPKPSRGWTSSEEDDFKQAVLDHGRSDAKEADEDDQWWYTDQLWRARQDEKCAYWNKFMKPSNPVREDELASGSKGLNSIEKAQNHLKLNMQIGGWPEWVYKEIERADSSSDLETESSSPVIFTPSATGSSSPELTRGAAPLPLLSAITAGVEALLSVPGSDASGRGRSSRGGRGRGGASRRERK